MKLIQIALKYCKKIVCTLLIILMMISCTGFTANENKYRIDEPTKIELLNKAEVVNWGKFDKIMSFGSKVKVLSPKALIDDVKANAVDILKNY